ncbi:PAS domain-containing protein [Sulfurimonas sp. SAG-AH-194-I05]|nr:HAMP domain-containing sensor histidine kinase [Sulfurimonas sp. SAG-AH-194-I05]MDF1875294.1 PAS domain-containing protein [Sulfurimonas sp. SAG-AH-194-I05]
MAEKSTQQYLRSNDVNEKLIASIDNGIIILDEELSIFYYNKWLEIHTQLKEVDVLNHKIDEVFTNINGKTLKRKIKTALRMETPTFYTATITKYLLPIKINQLKISGFKHMRQDVSVIPFDKEKRLVALIITDQTNVTNTNNLLQSNIKKVQDLNNELIKERETIDERVILLKIDTNNLITQTSRAYTDLLGFDKESIINNDYFYLERLQMPVALKEEIQKHQREKKVLKFEKVSLTSEGKEICLLSTLVPQYNQSAQHIGFIIFSENITNAKLLQEHQEKLLRNSRASAMGEMISMIAHQWRQPLSVINTIIATLKIKKELDILEDHLITSSYNRIEETVSFLSETIDDFRNFFKENKELKRVPMHIIFEKSNNLLRSEMEIYSILYEEDIDEKLLITTLQNELVQTIINILKNSVDAFKENPHDAQKLTVKSYESQTCITIEIEDNAGGIPKDILQKVFEPYFSTKSKNGTGLGLYVCKTIIEEHLKGQLTMRSRDNKTKTIIELPKNVVVS